MPDGFSTYSGSMGTSESEVSSSHIPRAGSVMPMQYTTWMVLHYAVTHIPDSFNLPDGRKVSTTGGSPSTSVGISIVLGVPSDDNDMTCDHISLESVIERNRLWHLKQYARFPQMLDPATQYPGHYDYVGCSDSNPAKHPLGAVGGGDCHAAQMSINNAIPGANHPGGGAVAMRGLSRLNSVTGQWFASF
jgi:hypothetical protein